MVKRPYIPYGVRIQVVLKQLGADDVTAAVADITSVRARLTVMLLALQTKLNTPRPLELHHRPALVNRQRLPDRGGYRVYDPPANDPEYLIYLPDDEHDIETRIRGLGAQLSDLAIRRKNKIIARNRDPQRRRTAWAKRKMQRKKQP